MSIYVNSNEMESGPITLEQFQELNQSVDQIFNATFDTFWVQDKVVKLIQILSGC